MKMTERMKRWFVQWAKANGGIKLLCSFCRLDVVYL
jgi:hypothetical protein